jgi:hypothetical protein
MDNNYFTNVGSYMQPVNPQEQQGLMPVFQNIAQQQQNQNAALAQQNQLTQQAGQIGQQGGGMNPMAMAAMLRKKPGQADMNAQDVQMGGLSTYNPFTQASISEQYGTNPFSESSRMIAAQERGFR